RVGLGERAAEDGEVLGEHEDRAAVDAPRAGDDAVAEHLLLFHAEVVALMDHELVDLEEGAGVEQQLDPLAGRLLAGLVLAPDALLAAAKLRLGMTAMELGKTVLGRHGSTVVVRALKVNGVIEFRRVFRS